MFPPVLAPHQSPPILLTLPVDAIAAPLVCSGIRGLMLGRGFCGRDGTLASVWPARRPLEDPDYVWGTARAVPCCASPPAPSGARSARSALGIAFLLASSTMASRRVGLRRHTQEDLLALRHLLSVTCERPADLSGRKSHDAAGSVGRNSWAGLAVLGLDQSLLVCLAALDYGCVMPSGNPRE